ncbi:MAG: DUF222 domain-containing protein [Actinomycetes bacterium]
MFESVVSPTSVVDSPGFAMPSVEVMETWWGQSQRADASAALESLPEDPKSTDSELPGHQAMPVDWWGVTDRSDPRLSGAQLAADWSAAQALIEGPGGHAAVLMGSIVLSDLSGAGRLDFLQAAEAQSSWLCALQSRVLVAHVGHEHRPGAGDAVAELTQAGALYEAQLAMNVSVTESYRRWRVSAALAGRLGDTGALLEQGVLSPLGARAVTEAVEGLSEEHTALVQAQVLPKVAGRPVADLRRALRAAVDRVDNDAAARRHDRGVTERGVACWSMPDGLARLVVTSSAHDVAVVKQALTVLAGPRETDDPRTLGARRVDALLGLCLGAVAPAAPLGADRDDPAVRVPARPFSPVTAQIVVDLPTLTGLADHPCHLRGYGSVPAAIARHWLSHATTWQRLVTDPVTGHLLDVGPTVRFAPAQIRAFVTSRDQTCTAPGCHQPATRSDVDHHPPWQPDGTGGRTSAEQLAALCRHHHRLKTHTRWRVTSRDHGTTEWVSPNGRHYTTRPPPVLPD